MKGSAQTCSKCGNVYESGCVITYLCQPCTQATCKHDWMPPHHGHKICRACWLRIATDEVDHEADANLVRNINMASGVECREGVCGGRAVLFGTRISVSHIYALQRMGWGIAQILENYPHLRRDQLEKALAYADQHRDQMAKEIAEDAEQ